MKKRIEYTGMQIMKVRFRTYASCATIRTLPRGIRLLPVIAVLLDHDAPLYSPGSLFCYLFLQMIAIANKVYKAFLAKTFPFRMILVLFLFFFCFWVYVSAKKKLVESLKRVISMLLSQVEEK